MPNATKTPWSSTTTRPTPQSPTGPLCGQALPSIDPPRPTHGPARVPARVLAPVLARVPAGPGPEPGPIRPRSRPGAHPRPKNVYIYITYVYIRHMYMYIFPTAYSPPCRSTMPYSLLPPGRRLPASPICANSAMHDLAGQGKQKVASKLNSSSLLEQRSFSLNLSICAQETIYTYTYIYIYIDKHIYIYIYIYVFLLSLISYPGPPSDGPHQRGNYSSKVTK